MALERGDPVVPADAEERRQAGEEGPGPGDPDLGRADGREGVGVQEVRGHQRHGAGHDGRVQGRALHSSTFQLNVSTFRGIGVI